MRNITRPHARTILTALLVVCACSLAGCQLFSFAVASFAPKPKVKPLFKFPKTQRLLVFPDDPFHRLSYPPLKDMLAEKLGREMVRQGLAEQIVPYSLLQAHQDRLDRKYRRERGGPAPLDVVARTLAADRVLYVDISRFRLRDDPMEPVWRGHMAVRVRVVNADGECLWPIMPTEGFELTVESPASTEDGRSFDVALREQLADDMAVKIAKLFYEHREGS